MQIWNFGHLVDICLELPTCLTHVTLSSCKTGNPPHTHTTLCINTDQHLHKLSIYTVGIIIFPKHVLIQNLQASIRVEGDWGGTLAQIVVHVGLCHRKVKNGGFGASRAWNCRAPQHAQACKCGAPEQAQTWNGGSLDWFVGSVWLALRPAVNPEC